MDMQWIDDNDNTDYDRSEYHAYNNDIGSDDIDSDHRYNLDECSSPEINQKANIKMSVRRKKRSVPSLSTTGYP